PEQFRGQAKPATDLYGLGATLLFILTHKDPADFPEKRMKINFRPYVKITPEFADWFEAMLEPVIEDRFKSATEALAVLEGKRERIVPPSPGNLQPLGSRIVLERTPRQLKVKVPPPRVKFRYIIMVIGAVICLPSLGAATLTSFVGGNFFTFLRLILGWLIVLIMLESNLRSLFMYSTLFFYGYKLEISWFFLGTKKTIQCNIADVSCLKFSGLDDTNIQHKFWNCALEVGPNSYRIGSGLTTTERKWLATEIANFIGKPKFIKESCKNHETHYCPSSKYISSKFIEDP
ncbi:MAG: hypothetical protein ACRC8Y_17160, partial [Chroococcales cyanobacterium]